MKNPLIYRFLNQQHTGEELQNLHEEINNNEGAFLHSIEEDWNEFDVENNTIWPEEHWDRLQAKLSPAEEDDTADKVFRLQWWVKIAATLLVVVSVWFVFQSQDNSNIAMNDSPVMITETNDSDQPATMLLKDGTTVTLTAYSSLSYYENFNKKYRVVHLEGEAFFVTDEENTRPFVVISDNITSICRGKEFSISAFKDSDEINVTLASGQIEIARNDKLNSENNKVAVKSCQKYSFNKTSDKYLIGQISDCEYDKKARSMREAASKTIVML